jgi:A/G-specific adenine glycosylase
VDFGLPYSACAARHSERGEFVTARSRRAKSPRDSSIQNPKSKTQNPPALRKSLLRWFAANRRDLPWRRTSDPYRIWLSEVMLQQTRVETVIPYYERFLSAFPTVAELAAAQLDDVLRLWAGLGYYSRARNLHAAAKAVAEEQRGHFPKSTAKLATLAGVGRYTAAAIASIAFGERAAVLDGNVKRVLARLLAIRESIDDRHTVDRLWSEAEALVDPASPGDFNQAMMELGATICTPRSPRCDECPVRARCAAAQLGLAAELPIKARKAQPPIIRAVAAAIRRDGKLLIVQRPPRGLLGGMWMLPGGDLASGEVPEAALVRQTRAQTGLQVEIGHALGEIRHQFTHRSLRLTIYEALLAGRAGRAQRRSMAESRWIDPDAPFAVALATVDRKALALANQRGKDEDVAQRRSPAADDEQPLQRRR